MFPKGHRIITLPELEAAAHRQSLGSLDEVDRARGNAPQGVVGAVGEAYRRSCPASAQPAAAQRVRGSPGGWPFSGF
jgi:hypothetical protein